MIERAMHRKPNFFIVGAAKSGTTAMDEYLDQHPDIYMAAKEPHHFASDIMKPDDPRRSPDWYAALFKGARDEKVIGESSVFYLLSQVAAERIKEFNPDARILIHVRNPIDVIPSHHSQLVYEGREPVKDLRQALALEPQRKQGQKNPKKAAPIHGLLFYRDFVRFADQIARFFDAFGRERVRVIVYEDFVKDTAGEYRKTLEFLEVDPGFAPEFRVINANKSMRSEFLMNLVVRDPPPLIGRISRALFPLDARYAIKARIKELNTRYHRREPLDPETSRQLKSELRPEVERLSALLGRDLTHWCAG